MRNAIAALILFFALVILMMGAPYARAQETVIPAPQELQNSENLLPQGESQRTAYTNAYYHRCVAVPMTGISETAWTDTCMCHAVHMLRHLRTEELEILGTGKGRYSVNKERLYPQVYAPCFEFVAAELARNDCYNSTLIKQMVKTQEEYDGTCYCAGERAAEIARETAEPQMSAMLEQKINIDDAFDAYYKSAYFTRERARVRRECMDAYIVD